MNSPPPKPEVITTNFFAEPTVLLVPITSRDIDTNKRSWHEPTTPLFSNFLFTNLYSIKCLYFFIISSLSCSRNAPCTLNFISFYMIVFFYSQNAQIQHQDYGTQIHERVALILHYNLYFLNGIYNN